MKAINCWEYFKCGREKGGVNTSELGVCPASTVVTNYGTNHGLYSGRFCWSVNGTLCHNKVQASIEDKLLDCINCSFLKLVNYEEGREFTLIKESIFQEKE